LFADSELRNIYPTVRKGPPHQLLEYLNNSAMVAPLYGQSNSSECFGILCLKLMGCLVAILQQTHGVINLDNFLSVTDIAFIMHDGGVLSSSSNHHAFESNVFSIFDPTNVETKLRRLVFSKKSCRLCLCLGLSKHSRQNELGELITKIIFRMTRP
jgi:hypothetical protein